jgi:phage terminase large subunit
MSWRVVRGDCIQAMAAMEPESVHAVVCDPPYGLEFMGREWDRLTYAGGNPSMKTGDRPIDERDGDTWQPGSAYGARQKNPRCRNCGKLARGNGACKCPTPDLDTRHAEGGFQMQAWHERWAREALRVLKPGGALLAFGGPRTIHRLVSGIEDAGFEIRDMLSWNFGSGFPKSLNLDGGLGTALKPAWEGITLARKPLAGTVAANVVAHGTGALNIDATRIGTDESLGRFNNAKPAEHRVPDSGPNAKNLGRMQSEAAWIDNSTGKGRWPANVLLSHSEGCNGECVPDCPVRLLDEQTGELGASRFFYVAKASAAERSAGLDGEGVIEGARRNVHPLGRRSSRSTRCAGLSGSSPRPAASCWRASTSSASSASPNTRTSRRPGSGGGSSIRRACRWRWRWRRTVCGGRWRTRARCRCSISSADSAVVAGVVENPRAQAAKTLLRAQRDPVWFCRNVLGVHLVSYQARILQDFLTHSRVTVRSANGVGKTRTAAYAALWVLFAFPDSRVITTANTWPQIERMLWHEINQVYRRSAFPLGGRCLKTALELDDGRYAIGLASDENRAENFAGHHAPNLLLIYDEASGIRAPIFEAGEGYMTTEGADGAGFGARQLLIGNPTRPGGQFYLSHHKQRALYAVHHISAFDTPAFTGEPCPPDVLARLPTRQFIEGRRQAWGEQSPMYDVRVMGNFPRESEKTVIGLGAIEDAQARELVADPTRVPTVLGCDVARFGDDETVIARRTGMRLRIRQTHTGKDVVWTSGALIEEARALPPNHVRIVVDDSGVGGGVTDIVRAYVRDNHLPWVVQAFNAGERARTVDPATGLPAFPNQRSESWFGMAAMMPDLDLDEDEQLAADLSSPVYSYTHPHLQRVVERKEVTKKRLGRSPDRADAAILTTIPPVGQIHTTHEADAVRRPRGSIMGNVLTEKW